MFESPAFAQAGNAAASDGGAAFFLNIFPLLLIFVIMYFLILRPQQKRVKSHQEMVKNVRRGDTVVTNGGLIGKVTKVEDSEVEVELAPNVRVRVVKGMLSEVRPHGAKPAND